MAKPIIRKDISRDASLRKQVQTINENLAEVLEFEFDAAFKGLTKATTFIQGEAQEITPRRKGILEPSAFSQVVVEGDRLIGRIGYTAKYAALVHEMPDPTPSGKKVNWTKPGTGNKFLEKAVKRNQDMIIKFLREFMTL